MSDPNPAVVQSTVASFLPAVEAEQPRLVSVKMVRTYADGMTDEAMVVAGETTEVLVARVPSEHELKALAELTKVTKYGLAHSAYTVTVEPKLLRNALNLLKSRGIGE